MNLLLLVAVIITLMNVRIDYAGAYRDHMSHRRTTCVNGIFVMLVLLSHLSMYYTEGPWDGVYYQLNAWHLQLIVAPFFFYSGFGIMYSLDHKEDYIRSFPKRILRVLLSLDVSVLIYLAVRILRGKTFPVSQVLLALIGYKAVGNSNWYMFAILSMYLITFLSMLIFRKHSLLVAGSVFLLTLCYTFFMIRSGNSSVFYDTIFCYPMGMLYALTPMGRAGEGEMKNAGTSEDAGSAGAAGEGGREKLPAGAGRIALRTLQTGLPVLLLLAIRFVRHHPVHWLLAKEVTAVLFVAALVTLTTFIRIDNKVLFWLGRHVFEIYIMQRLPMGLLKPIMKVSRPLYLFLCVASVIAIAAVYQRFLKRLSVRLRLTGFIS